jgi:gamma-glutamyltranspeptidase/glutathione hydrolase
VSTASRSRLPLSVGARSVLLSLGLLAAGLAEAVASSACAPAPLPLGVRPAASASAAASASSARVAASASASVNEDELFPPPPPPNPPIRLAGGGKSAVRGDRGVVTSVEHHASRAGVAILEAGGNAVDAAVAMAFVLAVTHPSAGNLGGGGFALIRSPSGEVVSIDFRERAPAAATAEKNAQQLAAGAHGWLSAAVPGTVAGLALAAERYGTKPLAELVAPARQLAKKGVKLGARQAEVLGWSWSDLRRDPEARRVFGGAKGPKKQGDVVVQPDLAATLEAIEKRGRKGFYEGPVAARIATAMKAGGGLVTEADLASYEATVRAPLRFSYRGFVVDTMPPPSMGGIALAKTMLLLERLEAHAPKPEPAQALHFFVEAARRGMLERRSVAGDPDHQPPEVSAALARLLGNAHVARRAKAIDPAKTSPADAPSLTLPNESPETTHLSVVDASGGAVSLTVTLSASFGARVIPPGTGVVLSNVMGAFSPSGPNALAPGKRPTSSMTPTIVQQGGKLALVLGSPGGDPIPTIVAQVLRNAIDQGMTIDEAVFAPRVHPLLSPDRVRFERATPVPLALRSQLESMGHVFEGGLPMGDAHNVLVAPDGGVWAVADRREQGRALAAKPTPPAAPRSKPKAPR